MPACANRASCLQTVLKLTKMVFQTAKKWSTKDATQLKKGTQMASAETSLTVLSNAMAAKELFSRTLVSASVNQLSHLTSSVM